MADTIKLPHFFKIKFLSINLVSVNAIFSKHKTEYQPVFDRVEELEYGTFYHYFVYCADKEAETYFRLRYG